MSTPPITVLHVFDHSFPISDGYSFRSREIIRFLRQRGWRTIHVTSAKQGPTKESLETIDGIDFYRTPLSRNPLFRGSALSQWAVVTTLRKRLQGLMHAERPALVHVHSPCLNALAAIPITRRLDVPVIYEVRSLWEDAAVDSGACSEGDLRYRTSRMLETRVVRRVDHAITICEGLRAELLSRGVPRDKTTVVPNSVDLDRFNRTTPPDAADAARLGLTPGKTIGFVGSFFTFEGLDVLLRALPAIRARDPLVRVLLVGDGPDALRLRDLARDLGIEGVVIFIGRVPHADVERLYALMDILVYPRVSKRITELVTPLKPLEAMAQGKLVIASDVGGHREMVFPDQNGILFKAGDPQSLAETCIQLIKQPQRWDTLRKNGRNYVNEARSWANNVQIYEELYHRLLARPLVADRRDRRSSRELGTN
jgi:PEP-CTERM/exosortase A-associated glycosyltransferase